VGTRWLVQLLTVLEDGRGGLADLDLLDNVCDRMLGKSLCALGDFAVYPVSSYLRKYRDEFEAHVALGRCPFGGESSIEGIVAPVDQHASHGAEPRLVPA
jgi:NADH-quinone oxidoreductase subunit F